MNSEEVIRTNSVNYIEESFQENQYAIVSGFLDENLRRYLEFFVQKCWASGRWRSGDNQSPKSITFGAEAPFELLLDFKTDVVSRLVGKRLVPTYSYGRVYFDGSTLECHKDREECEYSLSINIAVSNGLRWDLYVEDKDSERKYINLSPGDALLYMGCERPHGREPLVCRPDQWMIQVFIHYVDVDGPYSDRIFDRKTRPGRMSLAY